MQGTTTKCEDTHSLFETTRSCHLDEFPNIFQTSLSLPYFDSCQLKISIFASSKLSGRLQTCWQTGKYPLRPGNLGIIGSARYSQGIVRITSTLWWFRSLRFGQWLVSFVNFGHPERIMQLIWNLNYINFKLFGNLFWWKSMETFGCHFQFFRRTLLPAPSIAKHIKSIPFKTTLAVNLDEIPPTRYRFDSTAPTTWPVRHRQFSTPARWMDGSQCTAATY